MGVGQARLLRDGAHLLLGQPAQGEQGPGQLLLGEHGQHIALVLVQVGRLFQQPPARTGVEVQPGVVSGGHPAPALALGQLQQGAELDPPVAHHAGVGGQALLIGLDKGLDDLLPEGHGQVKEIVGDVQGLGRGPGVLRPPLPAAGQLQGHPRQVQALPLEQQGGGGAVHPSAHGYGCNLIHRNLHGHFAEFSMRVYHISPPVATANPWKDRDGGKKQCAEGGLYILYYISW